MLIPPMALIIVPIIWYPVKLWKSNLILVMNDYLSLFVKWSLSTIWSSYYRMCLAVSKNVKQHWDLGIAVIFVFGFVTLPVNYLLENYVLKADKIIEGVDLSFLSFILSLRWLRVLCSWLEMAVEKFSRHCTLPRIFLPLIAVNCTVMGASLFMQQRHFVDMGERYSLLVQVWAGCWQLSVLAAIREKMALLWCASLRGLGITFITVGLMAIKPLCFSVEVIINKKEIYNDVFNTMSVGVFLGVILLLVIILLIAKGIFLLPEK